MQQIIGTAIHIIKNGETGFLVDGKDEWISILKKLINNKELRVRIGKNARDHVVKNYSDRTRFNLSI